MQAIKCPALKLSMHSADARSKMMVRHNAVWRDRQVALHHAVQLCREACSQVLTYERLLSFVRIRHATILDADQAHAAAVDDCADLQLASQRFHVAPQR